MFSKNEKGFFNGKKKFLLETFLSPSISAVLERFVIHPLDTIMTFQQRDNISLPKTISQLYTNFGVKGFYKGLSFPLVIFAIPMELSLFGAYSGIKEILKQTGYSNPRTNEFCSSVLTGLLVSAVFTPIDAKRIRDTLGIKVENPYHPLYLYRGFVPMTIKAVTHVPIALSGADLVKEKMNQYSHTTESPLLKELFSNENPYGSLFSGMITGGVAQLFTTPMDVVKTKFMADVADQTKTLFEHAKDAYEQRVLFNSLAIRIVRFSLHTGLMIMLIDSFNKFFSQQEESSSDEHSYRIR